MPYPVRPFLLAVVCVAGCNRPGPAAPATRPAPATSASTTQSAAADEARLLGVWEADDVDAQIGQVRIRLTFRDEGRMKLAAWSDVPFVGQVRDKRGPYEVRGNVLSSEAIRGGTSVEYWFDGGDLVIRYKEGKTVRFRRV